MEHLENKSVLEILQETDTTDVAPAVTGIVPEIDSVTLEDPNAEEGKVM
jgi:hypothetical protein